jgi:ketosteroid isomerase-like protein
MGDNREVIERYMAAVQSGDLVTMAAVLDDTAADDFVQEWPQSGERMRREGSKRILEQYQASTGTNPTMAVRDVRSAGDLTVVEGTIDYGDGVPVSYVGITQFGDGKVRRVTEYFANPFEPPAWRAPFVEKSAPGDVT